MHSAMSCQSVLSVECFITAFHIARIRPLSCVNTAVDFEAVGRYEGLLAAREVTLVVVLALMSLSVCIHVAHRRVGSVASIKVTRYTVRAVSDFHTR